MHHLYFPVHHSHLFYVWQYYRYTVVTALLTISVLKALVV